MKIITYNLDDFCSDFYSEELSAIRRNPWRYYAIDKDNYRFWFEDDGTGRLCGDKLSISVLFLFRWVAIENLGE